MSTETCKLPITRKGKRALTKVAEWLEAGAPHKGGIDGFSMRAGIEADTEDWTGYYCGTVCCIAGAIVAFNTRGWDKEGEFWIDLLEKALGKVGWWSAYNDDPDAKRMIDRLFFGGAVHSMGIRVRSPSEAARTLRHLIATGEVNWDLPK